MNRLLIIGGGAAGMAAAIRAAQTNPEAGRTGPCGQKNPCYRQRTL